jgi:hypothetical protein
MEQKKTFSLFGPLLLIAAGVIWLLISAGTIPSSNLWALTHIWPFLLIAAGVGLILKSFWKYSSVVVDVLIIAGLVLAIVYAPQLGWNSPTMITFSGNGEPFFGPGVSGSGNVVSETRKVSGFDAVSVEYPAQVSIKQGNTESFKIEAEDNLLPSLKTEVKDGTLKIFYKKTGDKHVNPTKPVVITITVKDLKEVDFSSAGELTVDGLKTDNLDVSLSGAGNLELNDINIKELSVDLSGAGSVTASGTTDALDVNISGFGDFKGADLHNKTAKVNISGAGSATVWVDNQLDANISGAGSVKYYGSPDVTKEVSGVGGVNHQGDK